jgi:fucose permease
VTGRIPHPLHLAAFVVLGLSANLVGPGLTALREQTGGPAGPTTVGAIGIVFVFQAVGYLVGALVAAPLLDRGGGHRALAGMLGTAAVGLALVPLAPTVALLGAALAIVGTAAGAIDVAANTLVVWSHPPEAPATTVGSSLNALHLCFGLGALGMPALVAVSVRQVGSVGPACAVVAVTAVVVAVGVVRRPSPTPRPAGSRLVDAARPARGMPRRMAVALATFFAVYVGAELGFAGWIATFVEDTGRGGASAAAALTTVYWAGFTAGRVVAVRLAHRVDPGRLLWHSTVATALAAAVLVVGADLPVVLIGATAVIGLTMAPQYPTMVAFADDRVGLAASSNTVFVAGASVGGVVVPWLFGRLLDERGVDRLPVLVLVACTATVLTVVWVRREALELGDRRERSAPLTTAAQDPQT